MHLKRLLIAVVVLAVVAGASWLVVNRQREQEQQDRAAARLLRFDDRRVEQVVLTLLGEEWRFERVEGEWRIVSPIDDVADGAIMAALLGAARRAEVGRVIEEYGNLADFGLDPPLGRVRLVGPEVPLLFTGSPTPDGNGLYVRVEGRPGVLVIQLVDAGPLALMVPPVFRGHEITGLKRAEVREVGIRRGRSEVRLRREGDDWWVVAPFRVPASVSGVEALFHGLETSRIVDFRADDEAERARCGFDGPDATVIELAGERRRRTVRLGAAHGEERCTVRDDRPGILMASAAELAGLPTGLDEMASERLTGVSRYDVSEFRYRRGDVVVAARREDDRWSSADGRPFEDGPVYALLVRILEARVASRAAGDVDGAGARRPLASLEYRRADGNAGSVEFFPGRQARVADYPGVRFTLHGDPPPVPDELH